jgi:hypothetical protein
MKNTGKQNLLDSLGQMSAPELRRLLTEHLTRQKLGLYWERDAIEHDKALNANVVLPRLVPEWSHTPEGCTEHPNLIIEGDNFDSLRLLRPPPRRGGQADGDERDPGKAKSISAHASACLNQLKSEKSCCVFGDTVPAQRRHSPPALPHRRAPAGQRATRAARTCCHSGVAVKRSRGALRFTAFPASAMMNDRGLIASFSSVSPWTPSLMLLLLPCPAWPGSWCMAEN